MRFFEAFEVWGQGQALLALDERMLKDIGVSRADAYREAARQFGDLPNRGSMTTAAAGSDNVTLR
jgi:hypothetical protein